MKKNNYNEWAKEIIESFPEKFGILNKDKKVDFEITPENSILNEKEEERLFELMEIHTHGYCHALSILLANKNLEKFAGIIGDSLLR